jgi:NAD-dependent SIR2 family protein deacetylase
MPEIEPFEALALSLYHNPGVYAVLVGSGLSRAAGIPTGWEITLDLVGRLGAARGVLDSPDWEVWYREQFNKAPSYSEVLDALGSSAAERRSILHGYIEPQEGGDGTRRPTKAHKSIAKLASKGVIRVILTTNFDKLVEDARSRGPPHCYCE